MTGWPAAESGLRYRGSADRPGGNRLSRGRLRSCMLTVCRPTRSKQPTPGIHRSPVLTLLTTSSKAIQAQTARSHPPWSGHAHLALCWATLTIPGSTGSHKTAVASDRDRNRGAVPACARRAAVVATALGSQPDPELRHGVAGRARWLALGGRSTALDRSVRSAQPGQRLALVHSHRAFELASRLEPGAAGASAMR